MTARRRRWAAVAAGVLATPALVTAAAPAGADIAFTFDATASADGMTTMTSNQSIPLGVVAQASGPTAQAHLTSLPTSDAFASFPYPGQTVAGAPGILGGIVGVNTPAYPFIVSSGLGDGSKSGSYPGVNLAVSSETLLSESDATVGSTSSGSQSHARVLADPNDGVTATSSLDDRGLQALGDLSISGVSDMSMAHRDSTTGKLTRSTSLKIASIEAPGSTLTLPDCTPTTVPVPIPVGLPVPPPAAPTLPALCVSSVPGISNLAGQTLAEPKIGFDDGNFYVQVPFAGAPMQVPVPASTVFSSLAAVGITATYQQPVETMDGIIGGALTFTTTLPAPPDNQVASGPTQETYSVGSAAAAVSLHVIPSVSDGSFLPPVPFPSTGPATTGSASTSGTVPAGDLDASGPSPVSPGKRTATPGAGSPAASTPVTGGATTAPAAVPPTGAIVAQPGTPGGTGELPGAGGAVVPVQPGDATSPGAAPGPAPDVAGGDGTTGAAATAPAPALAAAPVSSLRRIPVQGRLGSIYLVLALLAGLAFVSMQVIRARGVRVL